MSRQAFLDRVRQAAAAGRMHRVAINPVSPRAGYVGGGDDLCETLAREIELIGGQAIVLADWEAAAQHVRSLLSEHNVRTAVAWQHRVLEQLHLCDLLATCDIRCDRYQDLADLPLNEQREKIFHADIGITSVDVAIAETGTLAVFARPGQERVFSLVPPIHLAIIAESQIIPDLFDLFEQLQARDLANLPSNIALISGPSKTGDIELELTTGVHGPGKWLVVIVRDA